MSGETNLAALIRTMTPSLSNVEYVFTTIKDASYQQLEQLQPLGTFIEAEGLTVILSKSNANNAKLPYEGVFNCITLNVHSSLDAVGLTAAVSTKLSQSNISANVVAAYYHDHIFIAKKDADNALSLLKELAEMGV